MLVDGWGVVAFAEPEDSGTGRVGAMRTWL